MNSSIYGYGTSRQPQQQEEHIESLKDEIEKAAKWFATEINATLAPPGPEPSPGIVAADWEE